MSSSNTNKTNKIYKWLFLPYFIIIVSLVIVPILIILFDSFQQYNDQKLVKIVFTTEYYQNFYKNLNFIYVLLRSFSIAVIATFLIILLSYPLAYIVSKRHVLIQPILVLLINGTIWINMILKTQALVQIFSLMERFFSIRILESDIAMFIGYIYLFLPYMFVSIYLSIVKIDPNLVEAAKDLGANEKQIFTKIIFPLSLPGVLAGTVLILLQIVTNIIVPKYLGPTTVTSISELIENTTFLNGDIKSACVMAVNLTLLMFLILTFFKKSNKYKGNNDYAKEK
ncbi:MAG: ABC-type spermidine/putrescine transport system, permease component I [Candidatus Phytoplasma pruni]|uniref:ABC transporter permease n=1 Tax=Poinsettia branch-inducing phytoplasma TaxID=138647 RepID=UPI00037ABDCC|nr:ABC transporter permease [Poinsettia branch-inducing phytoplasma]MCQ9618477.1 ABC transporter permease [Candidatus Phytoplasma pruni]MDW3617935.1 ABC transporter permease [Candidatus Phytoplasma pruni]WEK82270.1 MAG: ABC-type spermidine/putrescine transport system, permease component I [Candidatus Phytoplasma pruni]